jgi:hypothetical protein
MYRLPLLLVLLLIAARPVFAGPITDPVIGVRGIDSGSEPSNSSEFFTMGGCPSDITSSYGPNVFCLEYDIVQAISEITSITLQFKDASGLIPNTAFTLDDLFNGFDSFDLLEDGFSVRFFFGEGGNLQCPSGEFESVPCAQNSTIQVYLHVPDDETPNPPYLASLRAINDVAVPEPALLVLMGTGLALLSRRIRRRAQ